MTKQVKPHKRTNFDPKGVKVQDAADEAMRKAARTHARMVITALATIAEHGNNEAARVSAMKELLDRGFGKNHIMMQQEAPASTAIQVVFADDPVIDDAKRG